MKYRFAQIVVGATFLLIMAGGNVTSKGAGLAVPDWPMSFGSFNPHGWTSNMAGSIPGVRDEHFHRLVGASVGLLVTVLAIWLWWTDSRPWVRRMGLIAWLAVVVQGVMGGLRVTEISLSLAIIHGCFAQAFFCLLIAIVMVISPHWREPAGANLAQPEPSPEQAASDARLRLWTGMLAGCVYLQLILGALFRHTGMGAMGIVHVCGALVVGGMLIQAAGVTMARPESEGLAGFTIALFLLYGFQVILGVTSYLTVLSMNGRNPVGVLQTYAPTVHVSIGAVILGVSFALMVRSFARTAASRGPMFSLNAIDGEVMA